MATDSRATERLIAAHRAAWTEATAAAPFVRGVADGSLPAAAFRRWLEQDSLFVDGLFAMQARLAAGAPRSHRRVLTDGLSALLDELEWFREHAARLGISLDVPPAYDNAAYLDYLASLAFTPYPVGLAALWAVEHTYFDAWSAARPGAEAYREFVEHWSHDGFAAYVRALQAATDEALAGASEGERAAAERAALRVVDFERRFWAMSAAPGTVSRA